MATEKKPTKKPYKVTGAFVWDGAIRKPSDEDPVHLTETEAYGLLKRGKIAEVEATSKAKKPAAKKPAEGAGAAS